MQPNAGNVSMVNRMMETQQQQWLDAMTNAAQHLLVGYCCYANCGWVANYGDAAFVNQPVPCNAVLHLFPTYQKSNRPASSSFDVIYNTKLEKEEKKSRQKRKTKEEKRNERNRKQTKKLLKILKS